MEICDGARRHDNGTGTFLRRNTSVRRDANNFDGHAFATDCTDGKFFDSATIEVEGAVDLPYFRYVEVSGAFKSDFFLHQKTDDGWWEILITLFQSFYDGSQNSPAACPIISA
jgi:hypothetical protein